MPVHRIDSDIDDHGSALRARRRGREGSEILFGQLEKAVPECGQRPRRRELRPDLRRRRVRAQAGGPATDDRPGRIGMEHGFGGDLGAVLEQEDVDLSLPGMRHVPTVGSWRTS